MGHIKAIGDCDEINPYAYSDESLSIESNYYRIVQIDNDGEGSISESIQIKFDPE
jgi:hypothetical protein